MAQNERETYVGLGGAQDDSDRRVRLLDALQRIAKASEDAASVLADLGDNFTADQLLQQAADHYRWATRVAERATGERIQIERIAKDQDT